MRIKLTSRQVEMLRPYLDRVRATAAQGSPGMLVGQIGYSAHSGYGINVGFLDHEKARPLVDAAKWEIPGPVGDRKTVPQNRSGRPPDVPDESAQQHTADSGKP